MAWKTIIATHIKAIRVKVIRIYFNFSVKDGLSSFFPSSTEFPPFFILCRTYTGVSHIYMFSYFTLGTCDSIYSGFPCIIQRNNAYEKLLCVVVLGAEHKFDNITQNRLK